LRVAYCHEPTPGLSHARNTALREVDAEVIAWLDDDELADKGWVEALRRGFGRPGRPVAVCGIMLPAQLETRAQVDFERYGGFHKGRGMQAQALSLSADPDLNPLYPLPNFGAGGNMAFCVRDGRRLGGFDPRLGAGTLTHGGEETQLLARLLADGGTIMHWPSAVTWHYHRRSDEELRKQFFGYSAGLTAFYVSMIRDSPKNILGILKLVPRGLRKMKENQSSGTDAGIPDDFPQVLLQAGRRGLLQGSWLYVREWRRQSRVATR
jgi:GT2 family glycosyltransferase